MNIVSHYNPSDIVSAAVDHIKENYALYRHHVACALVANDTLFLALHLDIVNGLDVCAEPLAISNALKSKSTSFQMLVSVAWDGDIATEPWVVTPCGNCRQILVEYAPDLKVILDQTGNDVLPISQLLPHPYTKR